MGQARQRGIYEHRKAAAEARKRRLAQLERRRQVFQWAAILTVAAAIPLMVAAAASIHTILTTN